MSVPTPSRHVIPRGARTDEVHLPQSNQSHSWGGLQRRKWDRASSYLVQIRPVLQDPRDRGREGAHTLPGTRGLGSS